MSALTLVEATYQDFAVRFTEDGWFNATLVAERFGKRIDHYLANADTKEYISVLCESENTRNVGDFVKAKRGRNGGTWLHPGLGVHFARWLDTRFAVWCDSQIRSILSGAHPHFDWRRLRHAAASSHKVMNAVLLLHRQMVDKPTETHHYINEARLINWALTGEFQSVDRDALATGDLDLLAKLEERNTVLLGCGLSYAERKTALDRFAGEWRATHVVCLDDHKRMGITEWAPTNQ